MSPIYSRKEVAAFASEAGWPGHLVPKVVAVVERESSRNSEAVNDNIAQPWPTGLMQVRPYPDRPSAAALKNPVTNLREGRRLYVEAGQRWGQNPWAVCSDRACSNLDGLADEIAEELGDLSGWRGFLQDNLGVVGETIATGDLPEDSIAGQVAGVAGDVGALVGTLGSIGNAIAGFIAKLVDPAMWKRLIAGAGALVLVLAGLVVVGKGLVADAAGAALGAVAGPAGARVASAAKAVS